MIIPEERTSVSLSSLIILSISHYLTGSHPSTTDDLRIFKVSVVMTPTSAPETAPEMTRSGM